MAINEKHDHTLEDPCSYCKGSRLLLPQPTGWHIALYQAAVREHLEAGFGLNFPITLGVIAEAMSLLGADAGRGVPIFITVNPARDTPQVLKPYIAAFGPRFVGLTGDQKQISAIEKEFHVYAQKRPFSRGA
jgi:hypothetical protein